VEKLVRMRVHRGKREYMVKWKGYTSKTNTWETEKNLQENCAVEVEAFRAAAKKGGEAKTGRKEPKKRVGNK
jgi:hypothetical protein